MSLPPESRSLWIATTPETSYPALAGDLEVDVAIVGAGLTGLVAAWLLTEAGKRVAVLEQRRIVSGETGHTTAHVTELVDTRYHVIEHDFGREGARLVARSNHEAIDWIERTSSALGYRVQLRACARLPLHRARGRHGTPAQGAGRGRARRCAGGVRAATCRCRSGRPAPCAWRGRPSSIHATSCCRWPIALPCVADGFSR